MVWCFFACLLGKTASKSGSVAVAWEDRYASIPHRALLTLIPVTCTSFPLW